MEEGRLISLDSEAADLSDEILRETGPAEREWEKVKVLRQRRDYLEFLGRLTGVDEARLRRVLDEFFQDERFRGVFGPQLRAFESLTGIVHGDIRLHSLTLYTVVRVLRPEWVVETGVASGKSSTLLLLGLQHNGFGKLISIDLPNPSGKVLPDGTLTHTGGRPPGWLVPSYLKKEWELVIGDARQLLPGLVQEIPAVDLFLHDSLHTYDHVWFELETVARRLRSGSVILVDDVDMSRGAFEEFLLKTGLTGYVYRNLAGARVKTV